MNATQRFCLCLDLKDEPALIEEYKFWHRAANIWPEIPHGIKAVGIENMEIYILENHLFMIIEAGPDFSWERDMKELSTLPLQQEWEEFVSRYQQSGPDAKSGEKWKRMEKIFSLV